MYQNGNPRNGWKSNRDRNGDKYQNRDRNGNRNNGNDSDRNRNVDSRRENHNQEREGNQPKNNKANSCNFMSYEENSPDNDTIREEETNKI